MERMDRLSRQKMAEGEGMIVWYEEDHEDKGYDPSAPIELFHTH